MLKMCLQLYTHTYTEQKLVLPLKYYYYYYVFREQIVVVLFSLEYNTCLSEPAPTYSDLTCSLI